MCGLIFVIDNKLFLNLTWGSIFVETVAAPDFAESVDPAATPAPDSPAEPDPAVPDPATATSVVKIPGGE